MRPFLTTTCFALLGSLSFAQVPLLEGHTVQVNNRIQVSPTTFQSFSRTVVVGPGVEITGFGLNGYMEIDLSDREIVVTATASHGMLYGELLGFVDVDQTIDDFVLIERSASWPGFNPDAALWLYPDQFTVPLGLAATVTPGSTVHVGVNPLPPGSAIFCVPGEGGVIDCPCLPPYVLPRRPHAPASGCPNSLFRGGARIAGYGRPRWADEDDHLLLVVDGVPDVLTIFLEGDALVPSQPFGDGVTCIGGNLLRFGEQLASAGHARYPRAGDPPIAGVTFPAAGTRRYYQAIYRNARADWCSPPTFNATNGIDVLWQ
ncbi:MAG: hypothetical protein IPJ77_18905 [Planctomycetes bacterium]|nr:hypothetical protein [Planctomycetota bacterium]